MTTLLATIFVLGVLVLLHEFGHFIVAKIVGVRVDRFSLGFPPRLIGKKIGDTDYCISAIPLGGYVKLAGMVDESLDKTPLQGEHWEFQSKPWLYRVSVILAGPLSNYLVAILLFAGLVLANGVGYVEDTSVGEVVSEYPAEKAGICVNDKIVAINGQPVEHWEDMTEIIHSRPNQEVTVEWERDGEKYVAVMRTQSQKAPVDGEIREIGLIGIGPKVYTRKVGVLSAVRHGAERTVYLTKLIYTSLKMVVTGEESVRSIGGPLVIAKLAGESARSGWESILAFMAFLSLNFAILNLLPIPALDGGHLLFLVIEGIARRPVPIKAKMIIQQIGMALLFSLIILVLFNDIRNVFLSK